MCIPFVQKDKLKREYGLRWDTKKLMWYTQNPHTFSNLSDYHVVTLDVPYQSKEIAKGLGAQWNKSLKTWITGKLNYKMNLKSYKQCCDEDYESSDEDEDEDEDDGDSQLDCDGCPRDYYTEPKLKKIKTK